MVRAKFNYPDLDVLDSPLMSPTPLTSVGGIPGSAIAEKIFNDPDSWEENDDNDADVPEDLVDDTLAWLADEIHTPSLINSASTVASSTQDSPSPVTIYSASTTMSFLEWYGIHPDSPLNSRSIMQQRRKTAKQKTPALTAPSPRHIMRSSSLVSPSPLRDTFPRPPEKRVSSVPPPELELLRSRSPSPTPTQPLKPSNPPPDVNSGMSNSNANGIAKRRRLPSIPLDSSASPSLQIQVHTPALVSSRLLSSPRSSTAPPSSLSTGVFASPVPTSQLQPFASKSLSASRPPLVGPAGPRTRASQSRMSRRQDVNTRDTSLTHQPPVLRL